MGVNGDKRSPKGAVDQKHFVGRMLKIEVFDIKPTYTYAIFIPDDHTTFDEKSVRGS